MGSKQPESSRLTPVPVVTGLHARAACLVRWCWVIWAAIALLLYYPIFQTRPVFDDFGHVVFAAQHGRHLLDMGPIFFRPFERLLIGIDWMHSGLSFPLVKAAALAVLLMQTGLVYGLAARIVPSARTWAPWVIATVFLVHPMHVGAIGKIDTISESLAALFALVIVRCAFVAAQSPPALRQALLAGALVLPGMLSKESFAGIAAVTPLMFAAAIGWSTREARRVLAALIALEALAGAAYFALRHAAGFSLAGASTATARYALHFGVNVPRNIGAELASIAFPGSTYQAFVQHNLAHIVISAGLLAAFLWLYREPLYGLIFKARSLRPDHRQTVCILLLALLGAFFPSCLIPELVSEHQTATALPFVVLLTLACPLVVARIGSLADGRAVAAAAVAIVWMAGACADKILAARDTSIRAYRFGDEIVAAYDAHPTSHVVVCFSRSMRSEPRKYSYLSMPDDLAAFFQLSRLKARSPAPSIDVIDLRLATSGAAPQCDITLAGPAISRN